MTTSIDRLVSTDLAALGDASRRARPRCATPGSIATAAPARRRAAMRSRTSAASSSR